MNIILFTEDLSNSAGIERMTIELSNLLIQNHKISIVTIEKINKLPYPLHPNVEILSINSSFKLKNYPKIIKTLRSILIKNQPNILISVAVPLVRLAYPAMLGLKIKHIGWEHFNLYAGSKVGFLWRLLSTKLVDITVVLTDADKRNYQKYVHSKIKCIPNFSTINIKKQSCIDSNIIVAVGRLEYQKGFDLLLEAWKKISNRIAPWNLLIVGSGSKRNELIEFIRKNNLEDSVTLLPATPNISTIYENASIFVMSSRFEGLPMVLIEAKMAGLPCISFNCPNGPNEVIRNNIDGYVIENGNINQLSEILLNATKDRNSLKQMGKEAYRDAQLRFSLEAIKKEWNNLLNF